MSEHGNIDRGFIADLVAQLAAQRKQGRDVLLVSSGAIRAGREILFNNFRDQSLEDSPNSIRSLERNPKLLDTLPYKQAAAAVGQGMLIHTYSEAFAWRGVQCAQILLTRDDLSDRRRFLNARNTLLSLLELGIIPIINENDTVAVDEIKFGDNDHLAALVATLVEADLLLILSDVDGLYSVAPTENTELNLSSGGEIIPVVNRIDDAIVAIAGGSRNSLGTGGMSTKVTAAKIAVESGIRAVIAKGRRVEVISDVVNGKPVGTTFQPYSGSEKIPARKRWIAHGARIRGSVIVNDRAKEKLLSSGVSLLAAGILETAGNFASGDLIEICDTAGHSFAKGLANYTSVELHRLMGLRSEQFEEILGYRGFDEIIHRDNLVLNF